MTPEEFKAARRALGLTQSQLARILGITPQTLRKYEMPPTRSTHRSVHPTVARAVNWLCDGFRPPEWPTQRAEQERPD